jgi:hypothetical protein
MPLLPAPRLLTVGVIAAELNVSVDRICRILQNRRHIRPVALAGNIRLFRNEAVAQIRHELNAIAARRDARSKGAGK